MKALLQWNDLFIGDRGGGSCLSHPEIDAKLRSRRSDLVELAIDAARNTRATSTYDNAMQLEAIQQMLLPNGTKYKYNPNPADACYINNGEHNNIQ